jgi:hypothetical protein
MKNNKCYNKNPVIDLLPKNAQLIQVFGEKMFYFKENKCFFDENEVTPEFYFLMKVPFKYWMTLTFTSAFFYTSNTEQGRRNLINTSILYPLNKALKTSFSENNIGNKTVRCFWVNEVGSDGKIHVHILFYLQPDLAVMVKDTVWRYLQAFKQEEVFGVESLDVDQITYQAGVVSYCCKVQWGETYKHFDYSLGFFEVIKRFHSSKWALDDKSFFTKPAVKAPTSLEKTIAELLERIESRRNVELVG